MAGRTATWGGQSSRFENGLLRIRNIEARNLRNADAFSESDPFVTFSIAGQTHKTFTVWDNEKNPTWLQELPAFHVNSLTAAPILQLRVDDEDMMNSPDSLGRVNDGSGGLNVLRLLQEGGYGSTGAGFGFGFTAGGMMGG
ncbi:unnamed protein product, partial [Polarella glacialis]